MFTPNWHAWFHLTGAARFSAMLPANQTVPLGTQLARVRVRVLERASENA